MIREVMMTQRLQTSAFTIIPQSKLRLGKVLGEGGFGKVYHALHSDWGDVAVKQLNTGRIGNKLKKKLQDEARKLINLRHRNIIMLFGVVTEEDCYALVLEYMVNGSVDFLLQNVDLSYAMKSDILHGILLGMNFLHTCHPPIVHCDLKAQNVLVDKALNVKITDFGLSTWRSTSRSTTTGRRGTATHIPPESWADINLAPSFSFDVYSFAILVWEMMTENVPFPGRSNAQVCEGVKAGNRPDTAELPEDTPPVLLQLIKEGWRQEPNNRPSFYDMKYTLEQSYFYRESQKSLEVERIELMRRLDTSDLERDGPAEEASDPFVGLPERLQSLEVSSRTEDEAAMRVQHDDIGMRVTPVGGVDGSVASGAADLQIQDTPTSAYGAAGADSHSHPGYRSQAVPTGQVYEGSCRDMSRLRNPSIDPPVRVREESTSASQMCDTVLKRTIHNNCYGPTSGSAQSDNHLVDPSPRVQNRAHDPVIGGQSCDAGRIQSQTVQRPQNGAAPILSTSRLAGGLPMGQSQDDIVSDASPSLTDAQPSHRPTAGPQPKYQPRAQNTRIGPADPRGGSVPQPGAARPQPSQSVPRGTRQSTKPRFPMAHPHFQPRQPTYQGPQGTFGWTPQNFMQNFQFPDLSNFKPSIVHRGESGSTTLVAGLDGMEGVQIGDKNVMYVNSGSRGGHAGQSPHLRPPQHRTGAGRVIEPRGTVTNSEQVLDVPNITIVSKHLGKEWMEVGRKLKFSQGQLEQINIDYHPHGVEEKIFQMLNQWKQALGKKATLRALANTLWDTGCYEVALLVKER